MSQGTESVAEHRTIRRIQGVRVKRWVCASVTWKLTRMNLATRSIHANLGPPNADSFRADVPPNLKADFVPVRKDLANWPRNLNDWGGGNLRQARAMEIRDAATECVPKLGLTMSGKAIVKVDPRLANLHGETYRSIEHAVKELVDNAWDVDAPTISITLPDPMTPNPTRLASYVVAN